MVASKRSHVSDQLLPYGTTCIEFADIYAEKGVAGACPFTSVSSNHKIACALEFCAHRLADAAKRTSNEGGFHVKERGAEILGMTRCLPCESKQWVDAGWGGTGLAIIGYRVGYKDLGAGPKLVLQSSHGSSPPSTFPTFSISNKSLIA